MEVRIIVRCSCGKQWSDFEDAETAESWWKVLDIVDPGYSAAAKKKGDKKTTQLALRIVWARHQAYRKEHGDKNPHEGTVTQEVTIESMEELVEMKKPKESA